MTIFIILFCVLSPLFVLWLTYKSSLLNKVGSIIVAYIIACTLGLLGVFPDTDEVHAVQTTVASATVPFAIPLMLFSADIKSWAKLAPNFIKSLIFGILGCAMAIAVGFVLYGQSDRTMFANIGGMLTGLYTGGNANLASLKVALGVDESVFVLVSAYSVVLSAVYLFFVIIFGKKVLGLFMPDFASDKEAEDAELGKLSVENHDNELFLGLFRRDNLRDLVISLLLSAGIIIVGAGVALLFPKDMFQSVFILGISLLSVLASMNKKVRSLKRTFEAGTFFILIFSVAVASQVSLGTLKDINPDIFMFTTVATIGALFFHVLLSAIFRVDTDTTLTTSISLICSPPFAPVMGSALHNKAVIGPGIAVGLFGYAAGTYIGFGLAKMLLFVF
ncbi:MAG: DUF819 family protein [Bacteroidaceae bacterium]|nr:DUF819 family protein [Bacteroidaceae bacterium]